MRSDIASIQKTEIGSLPLAIDTAGRRLEHVISTARRDRGNRIVDVGGWRLENYRKNPVVLADHSYDIANIIGRGSPRVERDALVSVTTFADTPLGNVAFGLVQAGMLKAWSVGWQGIKAHEISTASAKDCPVCAAALREVDYGRHYTQQDLLEYSAVAIPANPDAVMGLARQGIIRRAEAIAYLDSRAPSRPSRRPARLPGAVAASFEKARGALEQRAAYRAARREFEFRHSPLGRALKDFAADLKRFRAAR